jgi:poly-gamma-glutamate capsule biosynthesis protein CapA/YwtB (metallophosphatase superfamily)
MIKLIALGDLNLGNDKEAIQSLKYNPLLRNSFKEADIVFANLEGPVTNAGNEPIYGDFGLYSEFGAIRFMKEYGINLVSLANNHMGDFGPLSVEFTIDFLNENGIRHFGWGKNINEVLYPKIFVVNDIRIGCIGLTLHDGRNAETYIPGMIPAEERYFLPVIKKTKAQCDFVICSVHWGNEMYPYPDPRDLNFAHKLIDHGVDLILGHHPHVVQGYEIYKDKQIFYSLGNFVFKSYWYKGVKHLQKEESKQSLFLTLDIENNSVKNFEITPIRYNEDLSIEIIDDKEKNEFDDYFKKISEVITSKEYISTYRKFRLTYEFPYKKRLKEIFTQRNINFSLVPRLIKFIRKFISIALFRR